MKTYKDFVDESIKERTEMIFSNKKFRHKLVEDGWKRLNSEDEIMKDELYGTADGIVKIVSPINKSGNTKCFWGRIMKPSHNEIKAGDVLSYDWDELFVSDGKADVGGLHADILDTISHKTTDKINTKPMVEKSIFKDGEVSSTKQLLNWLGLISAELINRNNKELR